jgi:Leucine-rich repeat (LRR) protein
MLVVHQIPYVRGPILVCAACEPDQSRIPVVTASVDHLVLSLNAIENIPPLPKSDGGADASAFRGLIHIKSLTLSSNHLRGWSHINALAEYCPALETLNITDNPIIEG